MLYCQQSSSSYMFRRPLVIDFASLNVPYAAMKDRGKWMPQNDKYLLLPKKIKLWDNFFKMALKFQFLFQTILCIAGQYNN